MTENNGNGLPKELSKIEDGQHTVLGVLMWERPANQFGSYIRPPVVIDRSCDYEITAILVILGTCPGQNRDIPPYYRIALDNLTGDLSLLDIKERKVIIVTEGKIIEIF